MGFLGRLFGGKRKILVIEDSSDIRKIIRAYLERAEFEVVEAFDGDKGVAAAKAEAPDLILLDIVMPVLDGWGALKAIRAFSKVPVIMVTSKNTPGDIENILEAGANDYIPKPIQGERLVAKIQAALRGDSLQ